MNATVIDTAAIIAVGSELLTPYRADTNSVFLTARLNELAIEVRGKLIVGDDRKRLARGLERSLDDADLVVLTGGLGPTDDDVTRDVLAQVLGMPLVEQREIVEVIPKRPRDGAWALGGVAEAGRRCITWTATGTKTYG